MGLEIILAVVVSTGTIDSIGVNIGLTVVRSISNVVDTRCEGSVGVGIVTREKSPVREFPVDTDDGERPLLDAEIEAPAMEENADDPELREYLVGVDWIDTRDIDDSFWETGIYANQNTVTKLRNQYPLFRLYERFELEE